MAEARRIEILDTTLRDGEQMQDVSYTPDEKLAIAQVRGLCVLKTRPRLTAASPNILDRGRCNSNACRFSLFVRRRPASSVRVAGSSLIRLIRTAATRRRIRRMDKENTHLPIQIRIAELGDGSFYNSGNQAFLCSLVFRYLSR